MWEKIKRFFLKVLNNRGLQVLLALIVAVILIFSSVKKEAVNEKNNSIYSM